jgi:hypothetical protein
MGYQKLARAGGDANLEGNFGGKEWIRTGGAHCLTLQRWLLTVFEVA